MDRIIEIKVNGSYLSKDSNVAGVQHEANAKTLRIEFDEGWDGYAKTVTFWNALGEAPTNRVLTADLLEDLAANTRIYLCPIPGESMTEDGEMKFVIDGYDGEMFVGNRPCLTASFKIEGTDAYTLCLNDYLLPEEHAELVGCKVVMGGYAYTITAAGYKGDSEHTILTMDRQFDHPEEGTKLFQPGGKRKRSEECFLRVLPGDMDLYAAEPMDPTPTQAEQLQAQIDTVLDDMQERAERAETAATEAEASKDAAAASAAAAAKSEQNALTSENFANGYMMDAKYAAEGAAASEKIALESAQKAAVSEANAAKSETAAAESAVRAFNSENFADGYMQDAKLAAEEAAMSADAAAEYKNAAVESGTARDQAAQHAANAAKSAKEAAASAEKAASVVGGDFATRAELNAVADAAQSVLNVTLTSTFDGEDADKSHGEILDAALSGKRVFLDYPGRNVYGVPLVYANALNAIFSMAFCRQGVYNVFSAIINEAGVMHVEYPEFPLTEQVEQAIDGIAEDVAAHAGNTNNPHGVTAEQVGAVPVVGGIITGDVTIQKGLPGVKLQVDGSDGYSSLMKNANSAADFGTNLVDASDGNNYTKVNISHANNEMTVSRVVDGGLNGTYKLYHEGNKPAPADIGAAAAAHASQHAAGGADPITPEAIGALPLTGGRLTGPLRIAQVENGYAEIAKNHSATADYGTDLMDFNGDGKSVKISVSYAEDRAAYSGKDNVRRTIYHTGNIIADQTDYTAGSTALATGAIHLRYE